MQRSKILQLQQIKQNENKKKQEEINNKTEKVEEIAPILNNVKTNVEKPVEKPRATASFRSG